MKKAKVMHGLSHLPEYGLYQGMIQRCEDPNADNYWNYGARGIRVCKEWRADFSVFLRDVGRRSSKAHSLDRYPNKDGNYEPGNTRWATQTEQCRNARSNIAVTAFGRTQIISEWEAESGLPKGIINYRLKSGWSPEDAIRTPPSGRPKGSVFVTVGTETLCASEWARRCGVSVQVILGRIKAGLAVEKVIDPNVKNRYFITIGKETKRLSVWARSSPVKAKTISLRLDAGWSPERAVFTPALKGKERAAGRLKVPLAT